MGTSADPKKVELLKEVKECTQAREMWRPMVEMLTKKGVDTKGGEVSGIWCGGTR